MPDPVIYCDMDGVITDFIEGLLWQHQRRDLVELYEQGSFPSDWLLGGSLGTEEDIWRPVSKGGKFFWENLNPYDWKDELLTRIRLTELPWYICTTPYKSGNSYSGKVAWLDKHVKFYDVIMMKDKYLLAHENALLIDDSDRNCQRFVEAGGNAILFPASWNNNRDKIDHRMEYFDQELQKWLCGSVFQM